MVVFEADFDGGKDNLEDNLEVKNYEATLKSPKIINH